MNQIIRILRILLSKAIGFIIFLVLVLAANLLVNFIQIPLFTQAVQVINASLWIIIAMSVLFLIAEIFWALNFPFNLPAPFFSAVSSMFLVSFIIYLLGFLGSTAEGILNIFAWFLYPLVFIIILVSGLVRILLRYKKEKRRKRKD